MARTGIRNLRTLLLIVMVALVGGLGFLFVFGKSGQQQPLRKSLEEDEISQAGEGTALIGEDFDYTFTERERPIFRIRGDSIRADQGGTIYLDGVGLTLYDEQSRAYEVESKEASFNRESNEGRLLGNVVLKGNGLLVRTNQLNINEKGRVLVSPKPVAMRYGDQYMAKADKMRVDLNEEMYVLVGHTSVESLPEAEIPLALSAERTVYERKKLLLRVEGNATLRRGREMVKAQRLSAFLTPDEKALTFINAHWNVTGRLDGPADNPQASVVRFAGRDLAVQMQPDAANQPRKVILEGGDKNRAMIETTGAGITRTMTALQVEAMLAMGVMTDAEAFGGVEMRETSRVGGGGPKETRRADGMRAKAGFGPGGQLTKMTLANKVVFRDPKTRATGNRAVLDLDSGRGEFFGEPVEIVSDRGKMSSPRVLYNVDNQIVNAVGGVRAVLEQVEDSDLAGTPLGEGDGPVFVESREAFWRQSPSSFLFRGDVRAWRGENLMITTELKGDKDEDRLTATGGVKTLWIPADTSAPASGKGGQGKGKAKPAATGKRAPVEVVAQEMSYREGAGLLNYTGAVRVVQEGKTLTCERLEVKINSDNKAQVMTCLGDTKMNDPAGGRIITGQKAVYDLDARRMEVTGDKVTMKDREGNVVQGKRVIYLVDEGKVEVKSKDETAAPATTTPAVPAVLAAPAATPTPTPSKPPAAPGAGRPERE